MDNESSISKFECDIIKFIRVYLKFEEYSI